MICCFTSSEVVSMACASSTPVMSGSEWSMITSSNGSLCRAAARSAPRAAEPVRVCFTTVFLADS